MTYFPKGVKYLDKNHNLDADTEKGNKKWFNVL